jgi:hypothetical protein
MLMQDELGLIAKDLLADLERARPGFPIDAAGFESTARTRLQLRLGDLRAQYASMGSDADYERIRRELEDVLLRRYVLFARAQSERERRGGGGFRGGDIVGRVILSLVGLSVGGFLIWAPFIPIWEKWLPFVLMFLAPLIPDLQKAWFARQHSRNLRALERDMYQAGLALQDSQPLPPLAGVAKDSAPPDARRAVAPLVARDKEREQG